MKLCMLLVEYPHKGMKRRDYTEKHVFSHFLAVEKDQVEATDEVRQTTTPNNKEADKKRIMERFPKAFDGEYHQTRTNEWSAIPLRVEGRSNPSCHERVVPSRRPSDTKAER